MKTASFMMKGKPVPWKAPYVGKKGTFSFRRQEKEDAIFFIRDQFGLKRSFLGPVELQTTFVVPIPAHLKSKKYLKEINKTLFPTHRPDTTNYLKFIEDCLTLAGVWKDDSQVVRQVNTKRYVDKFGDEPYTMIIVSEIGEE